MREKLFNLLKFVAAIMFLPIVIAVTISFPRELLGLKNLYDLFIWGVLSYVVFHLFIFTPQSLYRFGQKLMTDIFRFTGGISGGIPLVIPFFTMFCLIVFYICNALFKLGELTQYFIFFIGFTLAMHMVLTAHDLYEEDSDILKAHYIFSMSLVYVFGICVVALLLDFIFPQFSFIRFFKLLFFTAKSIYISLFRQLFVV